MTNILEPWLKANGYSTAEPDRIGNIAGEMARQPLGERHARAARIKKKHGEYVARQIWVRANEIIRQQRAERDHG